VTRWYRRRGPRRKDSGSSLCRTLRTRLSLWNWSRHISRLKIEGTERIHLAQDYWQAATSGGKRSRRGRRAAYTPIYTWSSLGEPQVLLLPIKAPKRKVHKEKIFTKRKVAQESFRVVTVKGVRR
jgi:hypothetical protein